MFGPEVNREEASLIRNIFIKQYCFTKHVRSTREGKVFKRVCPSVCKDKGTSLSKSHCLGIAPYPSHPVRWYPLQGRRCPSHVTIPLPLTKVSLLGKEGGGRFTGLPCSPSPDKLTYLLEKDYGSRTGGRTR